MSDNAQKRQIIEKIQRIQANNFEQLALEIFHYQASSNLLYTKYLDLVNVQTDKICTIQAIPFLPISFFKTHEIKTRQWESQQIFTSSGTTGVQTSKHHISDLSFYLNNTKAAFEFFYGPISDYCVLALLPAYLERQGSSLVAMADFFIRASKYDQSGFFLNNLIELDAILRDCQEKGIPTLLLGVSFALLDLAEQYPQKLSSIIIMETGGMKGRRKELIRSELHSILNQAFQTKHIHSEYGMTELLSQAYSKGDGLFRPAPTMKVLARSITDPFQILDSAKNGLLNIIDLANWETISFIGTDDLGKVYTDGSFEILGRLDASDVRGCNLLVL